MTIALFFKVVALVLWLLAGIAPRVGPLTPWGGSFVAAGLFCWFLFDVVHL